MMRTLPAVGLIFACALSAGAHDAPRVDAGTLNGAAYRIEIPQHWNRELVLYAHGYDPVQTPRPDPDWDHPFSVRFRQEFLRRGFAFAETDYRTQGWAVAEAMEDLEALRQYFTRTHGSPSRTFMVGHSMGGLLTAAMLERHPESFDGGLALCGPLVPAVEFFHEILFTRVVAFDALFPGVLRLGPPDRLAPEPGPVTEEEIAAALQQSPEAARRFTTRFDVTEQDVPRVMAFYRVILAELLTRAGGNPFDNRDVIYSGFGDDAAFNRTVRRYAADPKARDYLIAHYTTTGKREDPLLSVYTAVDPLVDVETSNRYAVLSARAGTAELFVQRFVDAAGHCRISPELTGRAFDDLHAWVKDGSRPAPGEQR
ncbi:MAG TPA: alpha/beta fold hydrolase [Vicinamibacterales bacterium]